MHSDERNTCTGWSIHYVSHTVGNIVYKCLGDSTFWSIDICSFPLIENRESASTLFSLHHLRFVVGVAILPFGFVGVAIRSLGFFKRKLCYQTSLIVLTDFRDHVLESRKCPDYDADEANDYTSIATVGRWLLRGRDIYLWPVEGEMRGWEVERLRGREAERLRRSE